MTKNTISVLFLSLLITSLISCSGSTQTITENKVDSTAIETPIITTETATNPTFETLLNEFEDCNDVELLLKNGSCNAPKKVEQKTKMPSLATQIIGITGRDAVINNFGTDYVLESALMCQDSEKLSCSFHSLFKASWENLIFLSFTAVQSSASEEDEFSTILVFTKSGEFKGAFINFYNSVNSQTGTTTAVEKVEKTEQSFKLMIEDTSAEQTSAFYLIDKDGKVTHK